jgi:hypothetical protein
MLSCVIHSVVWFCRNVSLATLAVLNSARQIMERVKLNASGSTPTTPVSSRHFDGSFQHRQTQTEVMTFILITTVGLRFVIGIRTVLFLITVNFSVGALFVKILSSFLLIPNNHHCCTILRYRALLTFSRRCQLSSFVGGREPATVFQVFCTAHSGAPSSHVPRRKENSSTIL